MVKKENLSFFLPMEGKTSVLPYCVFLAWESPSLLTENSSLQVTE